MLTFETVNELTLKVTCRGNDILYTKAGAFIAGESNGGKNYRFEKVLLGPQNNLGQAVFGSLLRRVTGENLPLMKVMMNGDSVTYYANSGQHVVIYQLDMGEIVSIESENILAFTADCDYSVRFIGTGVVSQKGWATSTLTGRGRNAYVAFLVDGNPVVLSNVKNRSTIVVDPDAVICWMGHGYCDPDIKMDVNWKTFIGQTSGESYSYEWSGNQPVSVVIQPSERKGGISFGVDGGSAGRRPN
ncbi:MAG: AIM24 family protein [Lachnospiraceae bacterium]